VPHQANIRIIEALARSLDFPMARIFVNVECYGTPPRRPFPWPLPRPFAAGRVKKGDRLLFVAFGSGLTSGAITLDGPPTPPQPPAPRASGPRTYPSCPATWSQ